MTNYMVTTNNLDFLELHYSDEIEVQKLLGKDRQIKVFTKDGGVDYSYYPDIIIKAIELHPDWFKPVDQLKNINKINEPIKCIDKWSLCFIHFNTENGKIVRYWIIDQCAFNPDEELTWPERIKKYSEKHGVDHFSLIIVLPPKETFTGDKVQALSQDTNTFFKIDIKTLEYELFYILPKNFDKQ